MKCTYCKKRIQFWQQAFNLSNKKKYPIVVHKKCLTSILKAGV